MSNLRNNLKRAVAGGRLAVERLEDRHLLSVDLRITEFMASNGATLEDGDGKSSDWIEIYNSGNQTVDLGGYRLTDDPDNLSRWVFPQVPLEANEYLVVFASSQDSDDYVDPGGNLHTNFALNADGEYLAIVAPDESIVFQYGSREADYPEQVRDVSYGLGALDNVESERRIGYMVSPTPGGPNVSGEEILAGVVEDTRFSVDRGLFDTPQMVEISTETEGAAIDFTTDGSAPSPTNPSATRYTEPLVIDSTTTLRAAAFKDDFVPSNIDTHTYIFPSDVLRQDEQFTLNAGFPARWGDVEPDYGIDRRVIDEVGAEGMIDSLKSIPTMSLVVNIDDLFGTEGIYTLSEARGPAYERPTSVENRRAGGTNIAQLSLSHGTVSGCPSATDCSKRGFPNDQILSLINIGKPGCIQTSRHRDLATIADWRPPAFN